MAGLAERKVLAGAAGEQVGGGGVRDGAADSHGEFASSRTRTDGAHTSCKVKSAWFFLFLFFLQEDNLQRVKKGDAKAGIHRMEMDRIRFVLSSYLRSRLQKVSGGLCPALQPQQQQQNCKGGFSKYLSVFRLKSFSPMSWRNIILDRPETRRCFHPRSFPLPKSKFEIPDSPHERKASVPHLKKNQRVNLPHRYYANTENYLRVVALRRMPANLQTVDMLKAGKVSPWVTCMNVWANRVVF